MPNIFKHFLGPINSYTFPEADTIEIEDPPKDEPAEDSIAPENEPETDSAEESENGAQALLSYAQVQADEIVAQARREGEELLEQLRQQAAQEADAAREAARQEGFRQGYADGMTKAQIEGKAVLEKQLQQQSQQIHDFLDKASQARDDLLEQTRGELCDLSMTVAEKVIHVSLKSSREVIARMIQMATDRLRRREWVHIYVGGCNSKELAQITPELTAALSGLSDHIKIIPMAEDELGTCIIEMPDEIIDASVSTQLDNIRQIAHSS